MRESMQDDFVSARMDVIQPRDELGAILDAFLLVVVRDDEKRGFGYAEAFQFLELTPHAAERRCGDVVQGDDEGAGIHMGNLAKDEQGGKYGICYDLSRAFPLNSAAI